jgi:hypothetical protein
MWLEGPISRDRLAVLLALATALCLLLVFVVSSGTSFLMPGPLTSAHGAIENCSACHTTSGGGKLSWFHGLVANDPLADSKACLSCHKMPDTAFNAHGASAELLNRSTKRLAKTAAQTPAPLSARMQSVAFPTRQMEARGLYCATCHQEHQGVNFDLNKITNEQCRSCHEVQFDSFDGDHPKFEGYPFKRRTRIVYDHAGHFAKHFPEVAKKRPATRIPATCSTCHNSREDKRVMAVAPFEQTCTACHLDQIVGKERVSGPKGIAFLTLPGLDLQTLNTKNAAVGEWPDASEAELAPFMKMITGRDEPGRELIKTVDGLNLQDLSGASDEQIKAVTSLVWEIKGLFYALIKGKASDVLGDLNIGGGAKLSPALVADLTASIPRDVVASAQQQWLPNLATEMATRVSTQKDEASGWNTVTTQTRQAGSDERQDAASKLPPPMRAGVGDVGDGQTNETDAANVPPDEGKQELAAEESGGAIKRWNLPSGTSRAIEARKKGTENSGEPEDAGGKDEPTTTEIPPTAAQPPAAAPAPQDAGNAGQPDAAASESETAKGNADVDAETRAAASQPQGEATEQTDDLLFPTEEELRASKSGAADAEPSAPSGGAATPTDAANAKSEAAASPDAASNADAKEPAAAPADSDTVAAEPPAKVATVVSIESDVDPESWAEYGGWYRQDFAIYYRPTGHKDKFIYSWLYLTGPQAQKGDTSPASAVFDTLTGKEAQGSCTKCHSVDEIPGKGRLVNFSPRSVKSKQGRFTSFIHEPHFGILETRGCLTCHKLEKGRPYLESYKQGNPQNFASNFAAVKKDICQSCHTSGMARQDCLLCHKYHVNDVITPIINTKIPIQ